jgi:hypothetical protein
MRSNGLTLVTLIRREFIEYRGSFVLAPIALAAVIALISIAGSIFASQFTDWKDGLGWLVVNQFPDSEVQINIESHEDLALDLPQQWAAPSDSAGQTSVAEEWRFEQDWAFSNLDPYDSAQGDSSRTGIQGALDALNIGLMLVMLMITINYLSGALFNDRKDRSVLFWRSMPVTDLSEVLAKFVTIGLAVPLVYALISFVLQIIVVGSGWLFFVLRGPDAAQVASIGFDLGTTLANTFLAWPIALGIVAPLYAWGLLASTWASRSPALVIFGVPLGLVIAESVLLNSSWVLTRIVHSLPGAHSDLGWFNGMVAQWSKSGTEQLLGLLAAALLVGLAARIRRYRLDA